MTVLDLWQSALITAAVVCAPFLIAALVVGLAVSLLQAATQLQENVLAFVPKVAAMGVILTFGGRWVLERLTLFSGDAFNALVTIAQEVGK